MSVDLETKVSAARSLVGRAIRSARKPMVMWSGGKDSMVLLHLLRTMDLLLPIVHHRDGESGPQYEFADRMIAEWNLPVQDYPPLWRAIKQSGQRIETVAGYDTGDGRLMLLPKNLFEGEDTECGLEWLRLPTARFSYPWELVFIGHKSSDVDEYEGHVPLKSDWIKQAGAPDLVFPLRDWTDADVWEYTRAHTVPQDGGRYDVMTGESKPMKYLNNDWRSVCVRCLDLNAAAGVYCPKLRRPVPNMSRRVPRAEPVKLPDYIGNEVA